MLDDKDIVAQANRHINSERERFLCLASIEHNFSKRHRLYCVAQGATNIFLEFEQHTFIQRCQDVNVNVIHVSTFQARELLAISNINELSHIRLKLGGSHADDALRKKLRESITKNLQAGYGTTETGAIAFTDPNDREAGESVGQPLPGVEIRIVAPNNKELDQGERGEIIIRCSGIFRGYLGNSKLSDSKFKDGWFYTGDIGYIDANQRIYLCGRSDDMFIFNSINIYPLEIESYIRKYQGIYDVAVIPESSSLHGKIPIALIVFDNKTKPKLPGLKKYVKKELGIRSPRQYIIVDEISRNTSGKISYDKAVQLSRKIEDIREFIIKTLGDHVTAKFKPPFISGLIKGESDIKLNKFDLDSLARMELLVALEVHFDAIITPAQLIKFRYFGDLAARVLSQTNARDEETVEFNVKKVVSIRPVRSSYSQHHIINLVRRAHSYCATVTHFNLLLETLANRVTPLEMKLLGECNKQGGVLPVDATEKYNQALNYWLDNVNNMMLQSGKDQPEQFSLKRISPHVRYFVGLGARDKKTLMIYFAGRGGNNMSMPSAVLLQHTNSIRYDLLIISEPLNEDYRNGVPHLGKNVAEVIDWISRQELIKHYKQIRTVGCSAGAYIAIIAGYQLNAELAVGVGAVFHKINQLGKYLNRIYVIWSIACKDSSTRVVLAYSKGEKRDQHCARIISVLTGGNQIHVEHDGIKIGHDIFKRLVELGVLNTFLTQTVYADMDSQLLIKQRLKGVISL